MWVFFYFLPKTSLNTFPSEKYDLSTLYIIFIYSLLSDQAQRNLVCFLIAGSRKEPMKQWSGGSGPSPALQPPEGWP